MDAAHTHEVLLVDDEDDIREAVAAHPRTLGFSVREAVNGQDALEQLRTGTRPCAIILDLMMPHVDGWEFRERQRREPELARIPVALLSATYDLPWYQHQLGADAAFAKPLLHLNEIEDFVRRHCAARRSRQPPSMHSGGSH